MICKFLCPPARLSGSGRLRTAALPPSAPQSGDQSCSLGRAGGWGDPAGVWLRSNPGDYYHWAHRHTSSGICCCPPPFPRRSEVIMHPAILHCEPGISPQMLDKQAIVTWCALLLAWMFVCSQRQVHWRR